MNKNLKRDVSCMRTQRLIRLLAMTMALAILLGGSLGVYAAEEDTYRETRPEVSRPVRPQWTEQEVVCQGALGTLRGTLTVPKNGEEQMPVAILLHGLNTDRQWCADIAWCLADSGIASVRFDYGGNGKSDGKQQEMSVSTELKDTLAILDYVKTLSLTDPNNIFVVGKSMGGVEAVLAAKARQGEINALCLWYPGFAITDLARKGFLLGSFFFPFDPPETVTSVGYTYGRAFIREAQSLDYQEACAAIDCPVMILHGDKDFIAPISYSFEVEPLFRDCTLKVFPGGYHGFWGLQELEALNDTVHFIQENRK